ncbi:MAG: hypothetical protein R6V47_06585 [Candidatus Delongbacteria bacterium]
MRFRSKKGGIVLKILSVIAFILLILSIEVPRRMWKDQQERTDLARKRMLEMSDCEIVYLQETGSFNKDLKEVFRFAENFDSLLISAPNIDVEILDLDTTKVRISYTAVKHFKDLDVVPANDSLDDLEKKADFIAYLESIGCPTPSLVMESDAEEIEMLLQGTDNKDHFRWLKENYYKASENEAEKLYQTGRDLDISLLLRNPELKLTSHTVNLKSNSNILAIANYKRQDDIYWDFISKDKIRIEYFKDPEKETQYVNMSKYIFPDIETDETPYLCPSTLEPFDVTFNLGARVGMKVAFFEDDEKNIPEIREDQEKIRLSDNQTVMNYYLSLVKRKAERNVSDLVREYEMDGDSTYSTDEKKEELFIKFFAERLDDLAADEPLVDELEKNIDAHESESEEKFSEKERFKLLFAAKPGSDVAKEMKKDKNKESLSEISFVYDTNIIRTDTVSVKIESPIDEDSEFKGYSRNILQKKFLFGIEDDKNAGYVDNGRPSWKNE